MHMESGEGGGIETAMAIGTVVALGMFAVFIVGGLLYAGLHQLSEFIATRVPSVSNYRQNF